MKEWVAKKLIDMRKAHIYYDQLSQSVIDLQDLCGMYFPCELSRDEELVEQLRQTFCLRDLTYFPDTLYLSTFNCFVYLLTKWFPEGNVCWLPCYHSSDMYGMDYDDALNEAVKKADVIFQLCQRGREWFVIRHDVECRTTFVCRSTDDDIGFSETVASSFQRFLTSQGIPCSDRKMKRIFENGDIEESGVLALLMCYLFVATSWKFIPTDSIKMSVVKNLPEIRLLMTRALLKKKIGTGWPIRLSIVNQEDGAETEITVDWQDKCTYGGDEKYKPANISTSGQEREDLQIEKNDDISVDHDSHQAVVIDPRIEQQILSDLTKEQFLRMADIVNSKLTRMKDEDKISFDGLNICKIHLMSLFGYFVGSDPKPYLSSNHKWIHSVIVSAYLSFLQNTYWRSGKVLMMDSICFQFCQKPSIGRYVDSRILQAKIIVQVVVVDNKHWIVMVRNESGSVIVYESLQYPQDQLREAVDKFIFLLKNSNVKVEGNPCYGYPAVKTFGQSNDYDCGAVALFIVKQICEGNTVEFDHVRKLSTEEMEHFRLQVAMAIIEYGKANAMVTSNCLLLSFR